MKYQSKYCQIHRKEILARCKEKYVLKYGGKCKICGKPLPEHLHRNSSYCDECITGWKTSRQARWYRRHREQENKKRRMRKGRK